MIVKSEQDQGKCHASMHDKRLLETDVEAMTCSDFIKYIVTLAFIRHKKWDVVQPKHKLLINV